MMYWGIGTETDESAYSGYARQAANHTTDIIFRGFGGRITHLQLWNAEAGGTLLFYKALDHTAGDGDAVVIKPGAYISLACA